MPFDAPITGPLRHARPFVRVGRLGLTVAAAVALPTVLAACAGSTDAASADASRSDAAAATAPTARETVGGSPSTAGTTAIVPDLAIPYSDAVRSEYARHINTLADPETMAGRLPGTEGIARAERYIVDHFEDLGLTPAFPRIRGDEDSAVVSAEDTTFRQPFEVGGGAKLESSSLSVRSPSGAVSVFEPTEQFNALGYGLSGYGEGPLAFIGYSVEEGPEGFESYNSFATTDGSLDDLSGHIAMLFRFEPHGEDGGSLFADSGWSGAAGLTPKFDAAIARGAEAVIMITPPGVDDIRATRLESIETTGWSRPFADVPVVHMTPDAADLLLESVRAGVTLDELIADANTLDAPSARVFPRGTVSIDAEIDRDGITAYNVGAILPGRGDLADEYVVMGAHHDHVGNGPYGSRVGPGQLHPGADDNASGTSGVLTAASLLADAYAALPEDADARSILFLTFSAEESGLQGSAHYARNRIAAVDDHHVMINLDMIGSYGDGQGLEAGALASGDRLAGLFGPVFEASGLDIRPDSGIGSGRSDHASFDRVGIPNVFLFTGITDEYHTPDDTLDTIDVGGAAEIATLGANLALTAALDPVDIAHRSNQPERRTIGGPANIRVRVGIAPGSYSGEDGVLVGQVYEGTSADVGGVEEGDRITTWNGEEVTTVMSWMPLLATHAPGDEVDITVVRDGEELELTLELQARQSDG